MHTDCHAEATPSGRTMCAQTYKLFRNSQKKKKHQTNWQTMTTAKEPDTYKHVRTYEGSGWYPALADGERALSEQGAST